MKKNMSNHQNAANPYGTHSHYHSYSNNVSGNWLADHKKLLWGIGSAVALGAGALMYLKNKNRPDKYSDAYDSMSSLTTDDLNNGDEILVTTITELE